MRRLVTRMIAIIPAAIVTIWFGDSGTSACNSPSRSFPLVMFTASPAKMGDLVAPRWLIAFAGLIAAVIVVLKGKLLVDFVSG